MSQISDIEFLKVDECSVESTASSISVTRKLVEQSTVGNYNLVKTIGTGGYAKVKLAYHVLTGEEVAIKIIDKTHLSTNRVDRLFREVKIMQMLDHPNIVKLFEVIDTEENLYLIMEYLSGGDLFDYCVLFGKLNEQQARAVFRQIVSAVEYCHYKRIIHRDLKGENILLDSNMNIKITDFGLSTYFIPEEKLDSFCGTPHSIAPELFLDQKYGPEIDIWALGVLLYFILTGHYPFGDSLEQTKKNVLDYNYKIPHNVHKGCESLLKKIFVLNPKKRVKLKKIMKDKWINQGYKKGELKPYVESKNTMNSSRRFYPCWDVHVPRF